MARDFDGADDVIVAPITAMDSGDWTLAAWANPDSAGESSIGHIMAVETTGSLLCQSVRFQGAARTLIAQQGRATAAASCVTTSVLTLGIWSCVIVVFDGTTFAMRMFLGTLDAPIVEAGYSSQSAGSGARLTAGVNARMGNNAAGTRTWDGRIARAFLDNRAWTLAEMEAFRLGARPVQTAGSTSLRGYWPLDSPTAAQAEDLSGNNAHGTVTGAVSIEGPPVPVTPGVVMAN